jgi:hypothetical protein
MMAKHNDEVVAGSAKVLALLDASLTDDPITVQKVERLARKRLPKAVYDYYACGADDQYALRRNVGAFTG